MELVIEFDRERDGRWIADVPVLPGVICYGDTQEAARLKVQALALYALADRMNRGEVGCVDQVCFQDAPMKEAHDLE